MINILSVGIGGFLGSISRYLISLLPINDYNAFPIKTLLINVVGSFIIGVLAGSIHSNKLINEDIILLLKVGFCGGFTTFSTFALETIQLNNNGFHLSAIIYAVLSVILCLAMVYLGQILFS